MKAITKLQKTGYYVTYDTGRFDETYSDAEGHMWFSKALARQIARDKGGMYFDGNRTTLKRVVYGYLPDTLAEARGQLAAAGVTADSPAVLGADGERLAREERWT